jgi:hypothetical protein
MNDALRELMASDHWPYVWPCYLLAVLTFTGLAIRAATDLARWSRRAEKDDKSA